MGHLHLNIKTVLYKVKRHAAKGTYFVKMNLLLLILIEGLVSQTEVKTGNLLEAKLKDFIVAQWFLDSQTQQTQL